MSNITLRVDDELIKKVRMIAIEKNTTLTQMIRDYLNTVAEREATHKVMSFNKLEKSFERFSRDMGKRTWNREDLYE